MTRFVRLAGLWGFIMATTPVLAQTALELRVDQIMRETGEDRTRVNARQELTKLGKTAVPRLIHHAQSADISTRLLALQCFQYCWSPDALPVITKAMADPDPRARQVASWAFYAHVRGDDLRRSLDALARHPDPLISVPALTRLLATQPDADRMMRALGVPQTWPQISGQLPRYQHRQFTGTTRAMLRHANPRVVRDAWVALIHQMDNSPATRQAAVRLLGHQHAAWRELGAEYLLWHGTPAERDALDALASRERDVHARAAARAAMAAVDRRTLFVAATDPVKVVWPVTPVEAYTKGLDMLRATPTSASRDAVVELLRTAEQFEPVYTYDGSATDAADRARHMARLELLAAACGFDRPKSGLAKVAAPLPAGEKSDDRSGMVLVPPVRGYFQDRVYSFGELVGDDRGGPFAGSYHVGEDVAIDQPLATVVSIAEGVVKLAGPGKPSWGGLVVIEHRDAQGKPWCSLYGHLGPIISVRDGDRVKAGDKLGSLGRGSTWENGGYAAHLHFGIHDGSFDNRDGGWIAGYLKPSEFKQGGHGWRDPRDMLKSR